LLIAYVDGSKESSRLVNQVLPEVAKALYRGVIVSFTDINSKFGPARRDQGIHWDNVPAIAIDM
jgi:hypothetical protein